MFANDLLTGMNAVISSFINTFSSSSSSISNNSSSSSNNYIYNDSYSDDSSFDFMNSSSSSSSSSEIKTDPIEEVFIDIGFICGIIIYFLMMVALIIIYINKYRQSLRVRWTYVSTYVTIIGIIFLLLRITWCILSLRDVNKFSSFAVNRIGQFFFLVIFGVLLFLIIDTAIGTTARTFLRQAFTGDLDFKFLSRPIKIGFWVFVVISILIIIASLVESFITNNTTWFRYSEVLLMMIVIAYGVLYVVFGVLLYRRLFDTNLPGFELYKILAYWIGIALCFFIKAVQFILMIVNVNVMMAVQIFVFYIVAELGPIGLYAWVSNGNVSHENLYYLPDKPVPSAQQYNSDTNEDLIKIEEDEDDGIF